MTDILKDYLSRAELASAIGYCEKTLIRWELEKRGPPVARIGRQVLYFRPSLEKWLRSQEKAAA